jgi:hypothetical protein
MVCDYALGCTLAGRIYTRAYLGYGRARLKALAESVAALRARLAGRAQVKPAPAAGAD